MGGQSGSAWGADGKNTARLAEKTAAEIAGFTFSPPAFIKFSTIWNKESKRKNTDRNSLNLDLVSLLKIFLFMVTLHSIDFPCDYAEANGGGIILIVGEGLKPSPTGTPGAHAGAPLHEVLFWAMLELRKQN